MKLDVQEILDDFRNLDPKDPGAWPLAPRIAFLVGLFALILAGGGWFYLWSEQLDTLARLEQEEERLKNDFVSKKTLAVNRDLYTQQLKEMERTFGLLLKQLPNKSEVEALLVEINQAGMGRGLQFELFRPGAEVVHDFYAEMPITVRLTGTYHDFGAFAEDIGKLSRIVTLNNIAITTNPQAKDGTLVMDAITRTYRYLDDEELTSRRKADQEARKGRRR